MKPMMKCGHAANSTMGAQNIPACVICFGTHPGAVEVAEAPKLDGRMASCSYRGSCREQRGRNAYNGRKEKPDYGDFDAAGHSVAPSSTELPFFEHRPDQAMDAYYCGCFGWD